MTTKEKAKEYIEHGWSVIPVPRGKKGPVLVEWEQLRIKSGEIEEYFVGDPNIGLLLGEPSGGLVDGDMDCDEAEHAAKSLMPKTLTSGRGSKTRHHWYTSPGI